MTKSCWKVPLIGLAVVLAACSESTTGVDHLQQQLSAEFSAWQSLGIHDYDFTYQQLCFCGPQATQPVTLRVRHDAIVAALDSTGQAIPADRWQSFRTIDQTFTFLLQHIAQPGHVLNVLTFDPQLHYVTRAAGDVRNTADAGFDIKESGVTRATANSP